MVIVVCRVQIVVVVVVVVVVVTFQYTYCCFCLVDLAGRMLGIWERVGSERAYLAYIRITGSRGLGV